MAPQYSGLQPADQPDTAAHPENGVRVERQPSGGVGPLRNHAGQYYHPTQHGPRHRSVIAFLVASNHLL